MINLRLFLALVVTSLVSCIIGDRQGIAPFSSVEELEKAFNDLRKSYHGIPRRLSGREFKATMYMARKGSINAMNLLTFHYGMKGQDRKAEYWRRRVDRLLDAVEDQQLSHPSSQAPWDDR